MEISLLFALAACFTYQAYRFRRAGMHRLVIALAVSVAVMLVGYVEKWPQPVRFAAVFATILVLVIGGLRLGKTKQ